MTFALNGNASPSTREPPLLALSHQEDDFFSHFAPPSVEHDMVRVTERLRLEILLDKECIFLKGTGVDVEPARLSGRVALYLAESTSIKEITLQFRGKARLPVPSHESISLNPAPITYIVCNHEWSFLEGEKKHSHTLKAGRHFFPFQLQLGGSLPSSICSHVFGGAAVAYKLRAHASRPGLNHNLQAVAPVTIIRSFAPEALEYQQTLEIENTWPDKLMYSIMIPHKAWAAGDALTALVKFSPLVKGVGVLNINTSIHETTKMYTRTGHQEHTRVVASMKHEIVGGKAVEVVEPDSRIRTPAATPGPSAPGTPNVSASHRSTGSGSGSASGSGSSSGGGGYFAYNPHGSQSSEPGPSSSPLTSAGPSPLTHTADGFEMSQDDVVTYLTLRVPLTITPTHGLDPITVTHRIRWSILILNPDGHTSELRCSLPLHLLHTRLLEEARMHTAATRRLLIGGPEVPPNEAEDDMELPSYTAHVRDRVANMYLPESATMRVTNPWVRDGVSPVSASDVVSPWPTSRSGASSPLDAHALSHLPHAPGSGDSTPLDWVNSELLLSLSQDAPNTSSVNHQTPYTPPTPPSDHSDPTSNPTSRPGSRPSSRPESALPSRRSSRASSPERGAHSSHVNPHSLHVAGPNETYVHSGNASRGMHGLFKATMKPFTSITHPNWLHTRSHSNLSSLPSTNSSSNPYIPSHSDRMHFGVATPVTLTPAGRMVQLTDYGSNNPSLLRRTFSEVPDYNIASRGFIGGVPPLTSMRGLPSYEEAERSQTDHSQSDSNLAARFASAMSMTLATSLPTTPAV